MDYKSNVEKAKTALLAMQRHSWEQGVAMEAFLKFNDDDVVLALAKEAAYRVLEDGRTAAIGTMEAITDPCATGRGLLYAANKTQDIEFIRASQDLLQWALVGAPRNKDGIVYHMIDLKEFWVDSIYMIPSFLAAAGYEDEAMKQIRGYWDKLYLPEKGMMMHKWDDEKGEATRSDCWGGGNGWTIAALAEMIDLLSKEKEAERAELIDKATKLIEVTATFIGDDGLAHDVLDDDKTFAEANFPQMLSYSIYKGIKSGWLSDAWKVLADRCRRATNEKVDRYGLVQGVCGAPHFISPGVAPEGQAFYLMMEAAALELESKEG